MAVGARAVNGGTSEIWSVPGGSTDWIDVASHQRSCVQRGLTETDIGDRYFIARL